MSSEDSYILQSGRQSSDGTLSEQATSDGDHTAMTSIMDTDEEHDPARDFELEVDADLDEDDMISIYPASHYPSVVSAYHAETSLAPDYSHAADTDM